MLCEYCVRTHISTVSFCLSMFVNVSVKQKRATCCEFSFASFIDPTRGNLPLSSFPLPSFPSFAKVSFYTEQIFEQLVGVALVSVSRQLYKMII